MSHRLFFFKLFGFPICFLSVLVKVIREYNLENIHLYINNIQIHLNISTQMMNAWFVTEVV
jgi:hypothetical protein